VCKERTFTNKKGGLGPLFIFPVLILLFWSSLIFAQNKINLNTATLEELKKLPGVGEATAKNILEYRQKVGGFKNLEELKNVKGIGDKKLELLKNYLTLEGESASPLGALPFNGTSLQSERSIYYYRDERGIVHYTQFPETVPPKYRKSLKPLK